MQSAFKALSDPTRREIISRLNNSSMTAGEIAACFDISRASLSHHFSVLKSADLVRTERRGQSIVYSLNTSVLEDVTSAVLDLVGKSEHSKPATAKPIKEST